MKEIKKEDLKDGEIYFVKYRDTHEYITEFKQSFRNLNMLNIKNFYTNNHSHRYHTGCQHTSEEFIFYKATPEQKHWLETCIAQNKFVSYEDAMKTFVTEYVECIKIYHGHKSDSVIGQIYKLSEKPPFSTFTWDLINKVSKSCFKPSTKEAYDAQFKKEFVLPEKWFIKTEKESKEGEIIGAWFDDKSGNTCYSKNCLGTYYHSHNSTNTSIFTNGKLAASFAKMNILPNYTEITFEKFKKYVLKEQLEEPKDKVIYKQGSKILEVECAEGGIYNIGDKIKIFGQSKNPVFRNKTHFVIQSFRWSKDKSKICAVFSNKFPNGIGLDKIELYIEPKKELSLLEQAKLKYPIGTKFKNAFLDRGDSHRIFEITSFDDFRGATIKSHDRIGVYYNNEWLHYGGKWAEIVEDFVLPQHWCIQVTNENLEKLRNHRFGLTLGSVDGYITSRPVGLLNWGWFTNSNTGGYYREITLEQFLKYVVNE